MTDQTPPPCDNCGHPYGDHNGQSLGWDRLNSWSSIVGPPNRHRWGGGCSHLEDWRHTCPCAEWNIYVAGRRETQRSLTAQQIASLTLAARPLTAEEGA